MTVRTPPVTPELIAWMEELYPDEAPDPDFDEVKERERAAKVAVVRHLKRVWQEIENNEYEEDN